jgi:hypothetical protein
MEQLENKILLDTIKLQHLFIESLYDIKRKEYYIALEKLEVCYSLFDDIIQIVHPLSEIRDVIINLRDKIEYNIKQIKNCTDDPNYIVQYDIMYDKEIIDEISNDYLPEISSPVLGLFTCINPLYYKITQTIDYYMNVKVKTD